MQTVTDTTNRRSVVRTALVKEPSKILYRRYIIARLYVVLSIFITVLTMIFEPSSMHGRAAVITHAPTILSFITFGVCALALLDIIINDFAPDRFVFKPAYEYRHLIYMALALISFSISISIIEAFGTSLLLGRLWLDGIVASVVAILDIFARHRGTSWLSGTSSQS